MAAVQKCCRSFGETNSVWLGCHVVWCASSSRLDRSSHVTWRNSSLQHVPRPLRFSSHSASSSLRLVLHPKCSSAEQVRAGVDGGQLAVHEEVDTGTVEPEAEINKSDLLWRAAKLPIYSVAIIPLSVGGAVAYWQSKVFDVARFLLMLFSSVLIITWLNLTNDAYDVETGVDKNKKESVVNITGSQKGVLVAGYACLIVGMLGLLWGANKAHDIRVAGLLSAAIACGYVYQCPPFRLSYKGLGEMLCFFAFGPLATVAFYLSQAQASLLQVSPAALGSSILVGITTSLILFCSHFHQIEGDLRVGKMSPLVRLGTEKGAKVVEAVVVGLYLLAALLIGLQTLPLHCSVFILLTLPVARLVLDFISTNHANKSSVFYAKYYSVRLHIVFGLALVLGFCTAARWPLPPPSFAFPTHYSFFSSY